MLDKDIPIHELIARGEIEPALFQHLDQRELLSVIAVLLIHIRDILGDA